jgi:2'-5' RNA ligase
MTRGAEARLFVALDLPADVRARLATWGRSAASSVRARHGPLRLLAPDTLHVTLRFLGERPVGEIEALGEALAAACALAPPVGELALGAPLWLPPRRPRALAVELHDDAAGALRALHDALAVALAAVCELEPGAARGRSFRPHVTVARLRPADAPRERGLPATPALSFVPRSVTLHRSWLTPTEAVYEGLATHALVAPSG